MLGGSYAASSEPVVGQNGCAPDVCPDLNEQWQAGLSAENSLTLRCGRSFFVLALERGTAPDAGRWQVVFDHVETWSEGLAIFRWAEERAAINRIRILPSDQLRALSAPLMLAVRTAIKREGWLLAHTDREWILTRAGVRDGQ